MYRILELNPQLQPFEGDIQLRMDNYYRKKDQLVGDGRTLNEFANAYLYFGFHHE